MIIRWLLATGLMASLCACMTDPQRPDYQRYEGWLVVGMTVNGKSIDVDDIEVREFAPDPRSDQIRLTLKACNTVRFRWQLINSIGQHANLRTTEAVSSTDSCARSSDVDHQVRTLLRTASVVHFQIERVVFESAYGRLSLEPS